MNILVMMLNKWKDRINEDIEFNRKREELEQSIRDKQLEWDFHHLLSTRADYEYRGQRELWINIDDKLMDEYIAMKMKLEKLCDEYRGD